jgi:DUF1365 family protein
MKSKTVFLYILIAIICWPSAAWAYLDPATGSLILQALIGMFASIAVGVGVFWEKLKLLFKREAKKSPDNSKIDE